MSQYIVEKDLQLNADGAMKFLNIYRDKNAYLSTVSLLLSFPLGVIYFVLLVTGVSMGIGMAITLIGIPLLIALFYLTGLLARFERWLVETMLGAEVARVEKAPREGGFFENLGRDLKDLNRWKAIGYLMLRFPMGLGFFIATVTTTAISLSLITAPLTYNFADLTVMNWAINTLTEAVIVSIVGVFVGALALRLHKLLAVVWRTIAEALLGEFDDFSGKAKRSGEKAKNEDLIAA